MKFNLCLYQTTSLETCYQILSEFEFIFDVYAHYDLHIHSRQPAKLSLYVF